MPPAWPRENQNNAQFYAWRQPQPGTEPVWDFWNSASKHNTVHFLPALRDEKPMHIQFYAHRWHPRMVIWIFSLVLVVISVLVCMTSHFCSAKSASADIRG